MNFDLNINNYKKNELQEMFDLPQNYDKLLVDNKETKLRESILGNKEITPEIRNKTIYFLSEAKKILLGDVYKKVGAAEEKVKDYFNSIYDLKPVKIEEEDGEHMNQIRKNQPYLSSFPSEFFPGVINPIKRRINKQNLNIDSRFRDNYFASSSTNFNTTLPLTINNVLTMQLAAIELPTSFYNISKQYGNNFFTLNVTDAVDPSITQSHVVNVADGNYDHTGIVNLLNTTMTNIANLNPSLANYQYIIFGININGNNGSGQMFVSVADDPSVPSNINFSLNFQADRNGIDDRSTPLPLKLGWTFGFRNGIYENSINYVSEGIVDLSGPRYLYLVVDDFNNNVNNSFYSAFNSSILNKNILARISLHSNTFNIFSENNLNIVTTPRQYFGPVKIQNINIQLLDEYGRVIDLNNMDYSFSLTFQTVYDL
jgi:hypothetical protein